MILKHCIYKKTKRQGRNNTGTITVRHRGGGSKRLIRILKSSRSLKNVVGIVKYQEYDPNRNAYLSVIFYENGIKHYIIKPKGLNIGDRIIFSENINKNPGNSTFLENINIGTKIYNVEFYPFSKSKVACSGESCAVVLGDSGKYKILLLPSKEIRLFNKECVAFIGVPEKRKESVFSQKAGYSRRLGIRPTVRGSAMNAVDHPHGGGEGKAPIGRKFPLTPWGKHALGKKTRTEKKLSSDLIIRRN
jgi:ribosomal protein L2, bacterial/organellar